MEESSRAEGMEEGMQYVPPPQPQPQPQPQQPQQPVYAMPPQQFQPVVRPGQQIYVRCVDMHIYLHIHMYICVAVLILSSYTHFRICSSRHTLYLYYSCNLVGCKWM